MRITFYNSTEEMWDALNTAMEDADAEVQNWQKPIKKGDYFRQETEYGFDIFGEVLRNAPRAKRLRNYRFSKCYSVACYDGEMGDVHISVISEIISKERFEEAKKNGWK